MLRRSVPDTPGRDGARASARGGGPHANKKMVFDSERFQSRHIGPNEAERDEMLKVVGAASLDALMAEAIPGRIRLKAPIDLPDGTSEYEYLSELCRAAARNQVFKSFIGLGYYG